LLDYAITDALHAAPARSASRTTRTAAGSVDVGEEAQTALNIPIDEKARDQYMRTASSLRATALPETIPEAFCADKVGVEARRSPGVHSRRMPRG
jgi:hypothetical protein